MPSLSRSLEQALHRAIKLATDRHHEYATLEHLLLALMEDTDAAQVMKACNVDTDALKAAITPRTRAIILNTPAEEVIVERGRAAGVVAGGKAWRGETIAAGVNPKLLFDRLLPRGAVDDDLSLIHI